MTNMPGAVGRTSTYALANATLPYAAALANRGLERAVADHPEIASAVNIPVIAAGGIADARGLAGVSFRRIQWP